MYDVAQIGSAAVVTIYPVNWISRDEESVKVVTTANRTGHHEARYYVGRSALYDVFQSPSSRVLASLKLLKEAIKGKQAKEWVVRRYYNDFRYYYTL